MYQGVPAGGPITADDLISAAGLGLMQALERYPAYCAEHGFDIANRSYLVTYVSRRMKGACLDWLRGEDYLTRSARARAGKLRDVGGLDIGDSAEDLAARTGMSVAQVYETQADIASRPVSYNPADPGHDYADPEDVEDQAELAGMLAVAVDTMKSLPPLQQLVLACHFYEGVPLEDIAAGLRIALDEVTEAHDLAVVAVHAALARSADAEGAGRGPCQQAGACATV